MTGIRTSLTSKDGSDSVTEYVNGAVTKRVSMAKLEREDANIKYLPMESLYASVNEECEANVCTNLSLGSVVTGNVSSGWHSPRTVDVWKTFRADDSAHGTIDETQVTRLDNGVWGYTQDLPVAQVEYSCPEPNNYTEFIFTGNSCVFHKCKNGGTRINYAGVVQDKCDVD